MSDATRTGDTPTVVLVHGAFADGSSWSGVIERLQSKGLKVMAPANPLRGLASDVAYLTSVLAQTPGPLVLVGHSYGGAVISGAAHQVSNVVGLVFVAAFAPDEGEILGQVAAESKDSALMPALVPHQYPADAGTTAVELMVDPAKFYDVFAADLPAEQAAVMAASQRPIADSAFSDPAGTAAWWDLPSWAVIATGDKAAGTDLTKAMAERARATTTELDGSHVIMVSQPQAVADVILAAVAAMGALEPAGAAR